MSRINAACRAAASMGLRFAVLLPAACTEPPTELPPIPTAEQVRVTIFENVEYDSGLLFVRDSLLRSLLVAPANIPWVVRCRFGLGVVFGQGSDAVAEIRISHRLISQAECYELGAVAGRTVAAIVAGRSP